MDVSIPTLILGHIGTCLLESHRIPYDSIHSSLSQCLRPFGIILGWSPWRSRWRVEAKQSRRTAAAPHYKDHRCHSKQMIRRKLESLSPLLLLIAECMLLLETPRPVKKNRKSVVAQTEHCTLALCQHPFFKLRRINYQRHHVVKRQYLCYINCSFALHRLQRGLDPAFDFSTLAYRQIFFGAIPCMMKTVAWKVEYGFEQQYCRIVVPEWEERLVRHFFW
jgi:hypothetical protein